MQTVEQNRLRSYERFEENRRFEEMTDLAERLGYPIDTTIDYEMRGAAAYARTDTAERPFHNQTFQAYERGKTAFTGDQTFEVTRLRLEHEEALQLDDFGAGKLPGNILIKISKVPDAVVDGSTTIEGYRRDLLRSFVRVYYRDQADVHCRLFSLDHNHRQGMIAVGELLGIDTSRPSEEVLADQALLNVPDEPSKIVDGLVRASIDTYDHAIYASTGEITYAGSNYRARYNAMQTIIAQPGLMQEHMSEITDIMARVAPGKERELLLETRRERMAAAITLATQGQVVSSSHDASVVEAAAQGNYGRECATATPGMNQAQNFALENTWSHGECQVCFARTMVGSCRVCANCAAADDRGVDLLKLRDHHLTQRRRSQLAQKSLTGMRAPRLQKTTPHPSTKRYGEKVTVVRRKTIGGEDRFVMNSRGEIIDKL